MVQNKLVNSKAPNACTTSEVSSEDLLVVTEEHGERITRCASEKNISALDLRACLLLHLPRLVKENCLPSEREFLLEVDRIGNRIVELTNFDISENECSFLGGVGETEFTVATTDEARKVHESFHYLHSYRPEGEHFALRDPSSGRLLSLGSIANFDLQYMMGRLPVGIRPENIVVLSRFYSHRWSPKNSFSYFIGRLLRFLRTYRPEVKMIMTVVNPNLGFSGKSYNPSQWRLLGLKENRTYRYLDSFYVSSRELRRKYGTSNMYRLKRLLGDRIQESQVPLQSSLILVHPTNHDLYNLLPKQPWHFRYYRSP